MLKPSTKIGWERALDIITGTIIVSFICLGIGLLTGALVLVIDALTK